MKGSRSSARSVSIEGRHLRRGGLAVEPLTGFVDRTIERLPGFTYDLLVGGHSAFGSHPERMRMDAHVGCELALALGSAVIADGTVEILVAGVGRSLGGGVTRLGDGPGVELAGTVGRSDIGTDDALEVEDGNGRIGRAIAENALARAISTPTFSALSKSLLRHRKDYYAMLEAASSTLVIDDWLSWFADRALEAQMSADELVRFLIEKTRFMDGLRGALNERQENVLLRMLAEGPECFTGGLSAGNYATITGAPPSTITRDLADLVEKGALLRTGERKATRYRLNLATDT
ncbi:filamentation induced by cAMP/death on curing-related protein (plasmid) [Rhizobium gallicum bv. gallicum R602sp]|uniref:Filamentation induced by cAMP/death on curing-related protein n=1 Tax=Rhizobium gallicum bv. gallicum R602sp TaxID=1041138 RepID=A0A0B4XGS6_9HYPH|nr:filamentation induced by cAMP/death on curing-related protein [Rhizobium gallicum bv. gallicum R602sp]